MKTAEEYKRTLYEKQERALWERKIRRKTLWTSISAAACFMIVFTILLSPMLGRLSPEEEEPRLVRIMISTEDAVLRDYRNAETLSAVDELIGLLHFSEEKPKITEDATLYTVKRSYSDGEETVLYYAETKLVMQPTSQVGIMSFVESIDHIMSLFPEE